MNKTIGFSFSGMVQQVMDSVFKIEESLRRLKYRNMNVNDDLSISNADVNTDESKIREQIKLDVLYFVQSVLLFSCFLFVFYPFCFS